MKNLIIILALLVSLPLAAQDYLLQRDITEKTLMDFASSINNLYIVPADVDDRIDAIGKEYGHTEYFIYNEREISSFSRWFRAYADKVLQGKYVEHTLNMQKLTFVKVSPDNEDDHRYQVDALLTRITDDDVTLKDNITFTVLWKGKGNYVSILNISGNWVRDLVPDKIDTITDEPASESSLNIQNQDNDEEGWAWWQIALAILIGVPVAFYALGIVISAVIGFFKGVSSLGKNDPDTAIQVDGSKAKAQPQQKEVAPATAHTPSPSPVKKDTPQLQSQQQQQQQQQPSRQQSTDHQQSKADHQQSANRKPQTKQISQPAHNPVPPVSAKPQEPEKILQDAETLYEQGLQYIYGENVRKDEKKGVDLLTKADEAGSPDATYMLGVCYFEGRGVAKDERRAMQLFQKAADSQLVAYAYYMLALGYETGRGVVKDDIKAFRFYKEAVNAGVHEAHLKLGIFYETGRGGWKDEKKACTHYDEAAYHGIAEAEYHMGRCHYKGIGKPKDVKMALKLWRSAESKGISEASYSLALHYWNLTDDPQHYKKIPDFLQQAATYFQKAAEKGHVESQYRLAECLFEGMGKPQDLATAYAWYTKAADNGHIAAMHKQALCNYHGWGVPKNVPNAIALWIKAEEAGNLHSIISLAQHYEQDLSNPNSLRKALNLYEKAGQKGFSQANEKIRILQEQLEKPKAKQPEQQPAQQPSAKPQQQVIVDNKPATAKSSLIQTNAGQDTAEKRLKMLFERAMNDYNSGKHEEAYRQFLHLADKEKYVSAEYMAGLCNENGYGTAKSLKVARMYYQKAADNDHTQAQYTLGLMLLNGWGGPKDEANGKKYLEKAAKKKYVGNKSKTSMQILGNCYEYGKGTQKNYKEAEKWYNEAIKAGDMTAKAALDLLMIKNRRRR